MKTILRVWLCFSVLFASVMLFASACNADAMRIRVYTPEGLQQGTCFSIGKTDSNETVIVTAAHVIENAQTIQIAFRGKWYTVSLWAADPAIDLAVLQATIPTAGDLDLRDATDEAAGEIWGFGPEYHGRKAVGFAGKLKGSRFFGDGGLHAITGDSGAPVVVDGAAVGVVSSVRWRASHRAQYSTRDASTEIVAAATVREFVAQYYTPGQCGPNGCPIYVRPQIQQPRILGIIPAGPPRVVGVTDPIDSLQLIPTKPTTPSLSTPAPADSQFPADTVRRALEQLAKDRPELFRGPQGPAGPAGTQQPLRVILARDGKKIDEETIQPGQPLILDVQSFGGGK